MACVRWVQSERDNLILAFGIVGEIIWSTLVFWAESISHPLLLCSSSIFAKKRGAPRTSQPMHLQVSWASHVMLACWSGPSFCWNISSQVIGKTDFWMFGRNNVKNWWLAINRYFISWQTRNKKKVHQYKFMTPIVIEHSLYFDKLCNKSLGSKKEVSTILQCGYVNFSTIFLYIHHQYRSSYNIENL